MAEENKPESPETPASQLIANLESVSDMSGPLAAMAPFDAAGYRIIIRSVSSFMADRRLYDCIAVKLAAAPKK